VISQYVTAANTGDRQREWPTPESAPGNDLIRLRRVVVRPESGRPDDLITMEDPIRVETEFWVMKPNELLHLTYHLRSDEGITVLTTGVRAERRNAGCYRASFTLPGNLLNSGGYSLRLLIVHNENQVTHEVESAASFTVLDATQRQIACLGREPSVVQVPIPWRVEGTSN
jgi:lipopolysaccharide transport system ATP-binding protein